MTVKIRAALFTWTPEGVMKPHAKFQALCDRQYVYHEDYALAPVEEVGTKNRAHFFVELREAYDSLPETDKRFPSFTHFRAKALIEAGWANHSQTVMDNPRDARKHAVGLRKAAEYAVIKVSENVVDCWIAKSIAGGQIHADEWAVVKPKALDWAAAQARTTRAELERHAQDGGAR